MYRKITIFYYLLSAFLLILQQSEISAYTE